MRRSAGKSMTMCVVLFACVAGCLVVFAVGASAGTSGGGSAGTLAVVAGNGQSGAPTPGPATGSALGAPDNVAADAAGDFYIADSNALVIEKVTAAGALSVIAGDGQAGAPTPGPATNSALAYPQALAVDAGADVYIADSLNDVVEKVTPSGTLSIVAGRVGQEGPPTPGPATSSDVSPFGLAVDGSGDLYIADDVETTTSTAAYVLKVTPSGTLSIVAGTGLIGAPTAGAATSSKFDFPEGLAVDGSGNLYIGDVYANVIAKVTPSGLLSIVAGNGQQGTPVPGPAMSSPLNNPAGIAVDGNGQLYIANPESNDVVAVSPSETLSVLAGTGSAGRPTAGPAPDSELNAPFGVAVDGFANVYIADLGNAEVEEVFSGLGGGPGTQPGTTGSTGTGMTTGTGTGTTTTPTGTGVPGTPTDKASPTVPLPLRCSDAAVTLVSVVLEGHSVEVAGLARASFAGDRVQIAASAVPKGLAKRYGASTTVAPDGAFKLRLLAPSGPGAADARYTATVDGHSSLALKLQRVLEIVGEQRVKGSERVSFQTTQPIGSARKLRMTRELSCTKTATYKLASLPASGRITMTLPAPTKPGEIAYYRAVLPFSRGVTYSLPIEVDAAN